MKRIMNWFLLRFDRAFSTHRAPRQLLVVAALCVLCTVVLWGMWIALGPVGGIFHGDDSGLNDVIRLILGATNYPLQGSAMPGWYQLVIAIVGTMVFTAFMISTLSNILTNRAASHRKGFLRYYFTGHVLILGGSRVTVGILKSVAADARLRRKEVVILTNRDAEELWAHIRPLLTDEERKVQLTIYHGERNMERELKSCQAERASVIYIVGEDGEREHDSINVDCWKRVRKCREENAKRMAQCYLLLERNASAYVFDYLPAEDTATMETTVMNRLESAAQQVLIGDDKRWREYTLDRGEIGEDSKKHVHLVVVGMTQMGYAMATTAAHLCHYPNFDEKTGSHRTRITFIDPNAEEEMKMFKGRYPGLFELSHVGFRSFRSYQNNQSVQSNRSNQSIQDFCPDGGFGDFLDVEWEFVKGSVADDWVREKLIEWKNDEGEVLTVAFCGEDAERNMAQALYLPEEFFRYVEKGSSLKVSDPVIWVYQPENSAMVDTAREQAGRYRNLLPFGTMEGSFDSRMDKRIAAAKRINFLYKKQAEGKVYEGMGEQAELDRMWHGLSYAEKMSSIYAANSIYGKFRSMGIEEGEKVKDDEVDRLARMEHARWNMEKLLVGFRPLVQDERRRINEGLDREDEEVKIENKRLKSQEFKHKDIAPYDELRDESRAFDKAIVRNLADVISKLNDEKV